MFVVLGLLIAFVLIAIYANPRTRLCRWRERRDGEITHWTCVHCGATVDAPRGEMPRVCHRSRSDT